MQENNFESALCIHRQSQLYTRDVFSPSLHRRLCLFECFFVVCLLGFCAVCLFSRAFHGWLVCRTLQLCFPALFPVELFPAFNTLGLSCVLRHRLFPRALQRRLVFPRLAWLTCLPPFTALFSRACNLFHDLHTWLGLHVICTWHRQVCFIYFALNSGQLTSFMSSFCYVSL